MEDDLLTDEDLARRWKVELITICQWRWNGKGPRFFKMGRQAFYRPADVRYFEEQKTKKSTSDKGGLENPPSIYKLKDNQRKRRFK